jgi:hypothetical protein
LKSSISPSVIDINGGAVGEVEDVAAGSITRAAGSTTVRAVKSGIEDEGDIGSIIGSASEGTSDMTSDSWSNVVAVDEEAEVEDDANFALALILAALILAVFCSSKSITRLAMMSAMSYRVGRFPT